jgi:hypothetical protein
MCCFSVPTPTGLWQRMFAPKIHVSATNIFARITAPGVQALAYSMNLQTKMEVAMVLPVPVRPNAGENALRFIDLSAHPYMFRDLAFLFQIGEPLARGGVALRLAPRQTLVVHEVGAFIASYVPTRTDFDRLDPRFQLPRVLFDAVPSYKDYGFAVFQLKPGKVTVHPMAFSFPSRELDRLYFPTVHLHDGRFHANAKFDHALYYQHPREPVNGDEVSYMSPNKDYTGLVDMSRPMIRRTLRGRLQNHDIWVTV